MELAIIILSAMAVGFGIAALYFWRESREHREQVTATVKFHMSDVERINKLRDSQYRELLELKERERVELVSHHKRQMDAKTKEYTSDYRRDALNALAHLAENAMKDEVKLASATRLIHSVSPVTNTRTIPCGVDMAEYNG
jgi:biopolymer transport protein ExbB/TolQ